MSDEEAGPILRAIVGALRTAGIPHMLVGSFASTLHGTPRTTQDIDIVIDPTPQALEALLEQLPDPRFYVSRDEAREALRRRSMFNVIDIPSGWKIDLMVRRDRAFSREELTRGRPATVFGVELPVATAEDTVLAKLEWAKAGGSERQLEDVRGILLVQGPHLDHAYLNRWIPQLGVEREWARVGGL